jgi:hypothetical protein
MKLKTIFSNIWNYRRNRKRNQSFNEIGAKLENALFKKRVGQAKLENEMRIYLRRYLKVGADSKFIPLDHKSTIQVMALVNKKFGKRMKALDVTLNKFMVIEKR